MIISKSSVIVNATQKLESVVGVNVGAQVGPTYIVFAVSVTDSTVVLFTARHTINAVWSIIQHM